MNNKDKKQFSIVYQITNLLDGRIYIGVHTTYNINDNYMGSSKYLKKDIKNLGKQNFEKIPLHIFDSQEEACAKEAELVTKEFCLRSDTYNLMRGGLYNFSWVDTVAVKDKNGNTSRVYKEDPRFLLGEIVPISKGTVVVKDEDGNIFRTDINDPEYLSGKLISAVKGTITVKDKNNNYLNIKKDDPRFLSGELVSMLKDVKQHVNTSRLNKKHSDNSKEKMKNSHIGISNNQLGLKRSDETKKKIGESSKLRVGSLNPNYGVKWKLINNGINNKKIKEEHLQEWLDNNWSLGWIK